MSLEPVIIKPYQKGNSIGLDVQINSAEATIEDYYQALDSYILNGQYQRFRSTTTDCEGCDTCCQERIPLTSIDVFTLKKAVAPDLGLNDFLRRYCYVSINGPVLDISLAHNAQDSCLFLNLVTGKCLNYAARPLVCHTYICTPLSPRARKLRETVINTGMDELVRLMLAEAENPEKLPCHEAFEPAVDPEDWPQNKWTGRDNYSAIKLKDILPERLWQELIR